MSIVFRTEDVPPAARVDYWRHVVDRTGLLVEGRACLPAQEGDPLDAWLRVGDAGAVRVIQATTPPGECRRTRQMISRAETERYEVCVLTRGHLTIRQGHQDSRLGPGDLTLIDQTRPVRLLHPAMHHVSVLFPRGLLALRPDETAQLTGIRIPGDRGTGALVSTLARQLPDHLDTSGAAERARLGAAVLDLLTVALTARLDRGELVPPDARRQALLSSVYAFVEERLADPGLSPGMIAAAHHISLRYLHKLFESEPSTVVCWIRRRRLERYRRDLLDPALRARPVRAVAARWGFTSAVSFNRAFRSAYGVPPNEYRRGYNGRPAG